MIVLIGILVVNSRNESAELKQKRNLAEGYWIAHRYDGEIKQYELENQTKEKTVKQPELLPDYKQ